MVTVSEMRSLMSAANARGLDCAFSAVGMTEEGEATQITIRNLPGYGPLPMPFIAAAERIRAFLAAHAELVAVGLEAEPAPPRTGIVCVDCGQPVPQPEQGGASHICPACIQVASDREDAQYVAQYHRARKAEIKPAALFDDITGAAYKGFAFREILRTDEAAYAAAYILAEKVRHLVD